MPFLKPQEPEHYIDEDEVKRRYPRMVPSILSRRAGITTHARVKVNLQSTRPVSKFLSRKIPYELGAADLFRHRWLAGFKTSYEGIK